MVDLVVTRYQEPLAWVMPYLDRPNWRVFVYNTGRKPPPPRICRRAYLCEQIPNAGFEWHGYLRHLVDRYDQVRERSTLAARGLTARARPDLIFSVSCVPFHSSPS